MIQDIEELSAELHVEAIRNPLDVIVLEKREVEIHQPGSDECIAAQVPAKCDGIRYRETLRLDVADWITGIDK